MVLYHSLPGTEIKRFFTTASRGQKSNGSLPQPPGDRNQMVLYHSLPGTEIKRFFTTASRVQKSNGSLPQPPGDRNQMVLYHSLPGTEIKWFFTTASRGQKSKDSLPQPPGHHNSKNEHHHPSYFNTKAKFYEGITSKFDKNALSRGGSQVRGPYLSKLRRAEVGAKIVGVFRVKNHDFTTKYHIFSNFRGARARPPGSVPAKAHWGCGW